MSKSHLAALVIALALPGTEVLADDLTGANRFLCAAVQATRCTDGGDCTIDVPWNLNVPQFIEIDLDAKRLSTTMASGENRATAIEHLSRRDGTIVLQGFEMGRAFSFVITEQTGRVTVAVATEGRAVAVFGACTPLAAPTATGGK
jgi:hypothetical protein